MRAVLAGWGTELLRQPDHLRAPGYQSYAVLSICRILHTLQVGAIVSKTGAAEWAAAALPMEWQDLIARAVAERLHDRARASDVQVSRTRRFVEYARAQAGVSEPAG